jgi:hypothetical protein
VNYPVSLVADGAGTYRFQDGFEIRLAVERGVFRLVFPDGESCALVTEDRTTFFCEGDVDRLQFVREPEYRPRRKDSVDGDTPPGRPVLRFERFAGRDGHGRASIPPR